MNGLNIDIDQFHKLPQKQKMGLLYENTEELKNMVKGYKFELWTHRAAIALLFIFVGAGKFLGVL